jgi:ribosomal protein S18 acetylase RimI-like enzyme
MRVEEIVDRESVIRWLDDRFVEHYLEEWAETTARGGIFVAAYDADTILGYLEAEAKIRGSTHVKHVLVDTNHRRRGVARSLYDTVAHLTNASELVAQVPPEYAASVAFHDAYRRSIDPGSVAFEGGWWVCPAPQRF